MADRMWWLIDRWRTLAAGLTAREQGAYRNLLDEAWKRNGPLPLDDAELARLSGARDEWPTVRDRVLAKFVETPAGWHPVGELPFIRRVTPLADRRRA